MINHSALACFLQSKIGEIESFPRMIFDDSHLRFESSGIKSGHPLMF